MRQVRSRCGVATCLWHVGVRPPTGRWLQNSVAEPIFRRSTEQNLDRQLFVFVFVRRLLPCKRTWIQLSDAANDFNTGLEGPENIAIENVQLPAAAKLTGKLLERRLKISLAKEHARQFRVVQFATKRFCVDEGRTENLERAGGTAAFGNVGRFEQTHPGINCRRVERWHIWRRHHPRQIGFVEPHRALPVFHRQDRQSTVRECIVATLCCQLAYGFTVALGTRMHADEGFVTLLDWRSSNRASVVGFSRVKPSV